MTKLHRQILQSTGASVVLTPLSYFAATGATTATSVGIWCGLFSIASGISALVTAIAAFSLWTAE